VINIKSKREIELMKESGHINFLAHEEIKKHLKIGVSLNELNDIVDGYEAELIRAFYNRQYDFKFDEDAIFL
jgi:methionine aminopeptidase